MLFSCPASVGTFDRPASASQECWEDRYMLSHAQVTIQNLLALDVFPTGQTGKLSPGEGAACLGGSQRGGLARAIVAQEGSDVALVEIQAEPAKGWLRGTREVLLQAPDGDSGTQARWCPFHQHCRKRQSQLGVDDDDDTRGPSELESGQANP